MSATVTIKAENIDQILAEVDQLGRDITSDDVKAVMGRAIRNVIVDHFVEIANDSAHHRTARAFGAPPTGVYEQAARGTSQPEVSSEGVAISIHQVAIAQRFFGGPIQPVNAKFLAIPARSEAYGKRPREFDNLRAIIFKSGAGALVQRDASVTRSGDRGSRRIAGLAGMHEGESLGGLVFFWLVKQVVQPPDPTVLPTEDEMLNAAVENAQQYIERLWSRS
jgi:hypothetical protein